MLIDAGLGEGGFVVQACLPAGTFHYLLRPPRPADEVPRVVGEQLIQWPANRVCTVRPTLRAAKTFAAFGVLDAELDWELGG
jgi:hypothetical protein